MVRASPIKFHLDIFKNRGSRSRIFHIVFPILSLFSFILEDNLTKEFLVTHMFLLHICIHTRVRIFWCWSRESCSYMCKSVYACDREKACLGNLMKLNKRLAKTFARGRRRRRRRQHVVNAMSWETRGIFASVQVSSRVSVKAGLIELRASNVKIEDGAYCWESWSSYRFRKRSLCR